MEKDQIDNMFSYHPPIKDQAARYEDIRAKAREFAHLINQHCPDSREKSMAITNLQLSVMCANASIACNEQLV